MLSPAPHVHGGVSAFAEMLKAYFKACDVTSLWVGNPHTGRESKAAAAIRLVSMPIRVARLAKRQYFDVVHLNPTLDIRSGIRDGLILLALRLAGFQRVLVYFHGWNAELARRIRRTAALRRVFVWLLGGAEHIVVLSPEFKQELESIGIDGGRVTCARTMFDGVYLKPALPPAAQRQIILFMSRFVRGKGVHELLEAFLRIASDFPNADLVLAGDGPEAAALKERILAAGLSSRIMFPGYVGGPEKFRLLQECTIYALPTYLVGEGMPVALIEAMGAGKPLLTAKAGGIAHIVSDPENGVVLDTVTINSIEAGLRRLLGNPRYCREIGEHNRRYAWEHFEAGKVTAEIEALYWQIAGRP